MGEGVGRRMRAPHIYATEILVHIRVKWEKHQLQVMLGQLNGFLPLDIGAVIHNAIGGDEIPWG